MSVSSSNTPKSSTSNGESWVVLSESSEEGKVHLTGHSYVVIEDWNQVYLRTFRSKTRVGAL